MEEKSLFTSISVIALLARRVPDLIEVLEEGREALSGGIIAIYFVTGLPVGH